MPSGDGTGPTGMGPMTGRAAGHCAGYGVPGYASGGVGGGRGGWGRGRGGGGGGGRGRRHRHYATGVPGRAQSAPAWGPPPAPAWSQPSPEREVEVLKQQADYFEESLSGVRSRIAELEKATAEKDT